MLLRTELLRLSMPRMLFNTDAAPPGGGGGAPPEGGNMVPLQRLHEVKNSALKELGLDTNLEVAKQQLAQMRQQALAGETATAHLGLADAGIRSPAVRDLIDWQWDKLPKTGRPSRLDWLRGDGASNALVAPHLQGIPEFSSNQEGAPPTPVAATPPTPTTAATTTPTPPPVAPPTPPPPPAPKQVAGGGNLAPERQTDGSNPLSRFKAMSDAEVQANSKEVLAAVKAAGF